MIKKLFQKLESTQRPLLGPNVKSLHFWGLLPIENNSFSRLFCLFIYISLSIFVITEYIDIFYVISDINQIFTNLKVTMISSVNVCKATTFWVFYKHWIAVINYVTRADIKQRISEDPKKKALIKNYTKYCRIITYMYWWLLGSIVVMTMLQPILTYVLSPTYRMNTRNRTQPFMQVASSYVPFDKNTIPGHIVAALIQSYSAFFGSGWISAFDTCAMVIMVFFKGELDMIKHDSKMIFGGENEMIDEKTAMERLVNLKLWHSDLMKHAQLFDKCLVPVMPFYMIVCSFMICVTAYQMTTQTSFFDKMQTMTYLVVQIAQLFMFCWHSNDVLFASRDLPCGPYESAWWNYDKKWGKNIYILTSQFQKELVFNAGPFAKLTVATFITIIQGAYSYYTLLRQTQMK